MRHDQQVPTQTQNDGEAGKLLQTATLKAMSKIVGHRWCTTAPYIDTKKQRAKHVAGNGNTGKEQIGTKLAVVSKPRLTHENGCTHDAGNQGSQDQKGWRTSSGDKIVVQFFYAAPGITADHHIN